MMGPIQAIKTCLSKYATFSGRASRSEFWWWIATVTLAMLLFFLVDEALFPEVMEAESGYLPITDTFYLAIMLPDMAVTARRLQDFGIFGAWYPLLALPAAALFAINEGILSTPNPMLTQLEYVLFAAQLAIALLCIRPSTPNTNRYGPNPNEVPQ